MGLSFPLTPVSSPNFLAWADDLTCYSSVLLLLLTPWEPLVIITQGGHHLDHWMAHFNCASIWEVVFQLKLSVRCAIITLQWFHAHMQVPLCGNPGIRVDLQVIGIGKGMVNPAGSG